MKNNRKKSKILLISNKVYHYRVPVYGHLNERLDELGYELVVMTNELEKHAADVPGFQLHVQPFDLTAYREAIGQIQPDIVMFFLHARDFIVWPLLLMLKIKGTPVIYWNHGINLQTPDNVVKQAIFGLFHRFADAIILYSENEKRYVSHKHWNKLFIANNTINFNCIPEIPESKDELKRQLSIPFERVVLFVGRITEAKRLDDLISAAADLETGIGVVIVGDGLSRRQSLKIEKSENILYLGAVYDAEAANRVFKMADVFSIPGKVGLGVNQAFYWGLPIVTEDVRHSPEIVYVKNGVNGFIVDKDDTRMLAEKINFLLSSDATYQSFSDAARAEILENASIDRMCDGFVDAIHYLEGRGEDMVENPRAQDT